LVQEAMMERAKVEEILASVPKADNPGMRRGSIEQSITYYNELAKRFPKTFEGEQAAKRSEYLKSKKVDIEKMYAELAKDQGKTSGEPSLPSLPPLTLPEKP